MVALEAKEAEHLLCPDSVGVRPPAPDSPHRPANALAWKCSCPKFFPSVLPINELDKLLGKMEPAKLKRLHQLFLWDMSFLGG
jgi:hypothetical protein